MDKAAMALDFEQIHGKDTTDLAPANRDQSPSVPRRASDLHLSSADHPATATIGPAHAR